MLTQWSSVPAGFGKGLLVLTIGLNLRGHRSPGAESAATDPCNGGLQRLSHMQRV